MGIGVLVAPLLLTDCANVSFITKNELYAPIGEQIDEENKTLVIIDNGYKQTGTPEGWKLVWTDEFDKPEIDTTKWTHEVNGNGGGNNELQYYVDSPNNSFVKDGFLVMKAKEQNYKGKFYTSSRLNTKNKADWTYGRFDIRAKLPIQQGLWPAIWMLPTDYVYGTWPKSGEIDIMEIIGQNPSTTFGTLHYGDAWPNNKHTGEEYKLKEGTFEDEFHVFSVEWEKDEIRWYIDDKLFSTKTPKDLDPKPWPFDQKFHMILNVAVGGNWPGPPDENTTFPKYMYVDYVRVYQK